jgi:hypothetical protein
MDSNMISKLNTICLFHNIEEFLGLVIDLEENYYPEDEQSNVGFFSSDCSDV